ncbi:MAG TPA: HEAT repeat domain-containing protein [Phycisphaerae bacterium]|nr:HEAT repeat domain-containing protein [Phycisphaerae bacterium]HOQ85423.1 HEAT repeat domain-containing protein [Phycisphaerae bacterium]HQE29061.1 HEAT repeat domain-containing protein [Phycisphaerae bacterium]
MSGERTVFEILRTVQDPAADAALLAALQDADLPTASAIVETILTRNTREGLYGLIQAFHLLDDTLKQMVLIEWERLFSVLREASQSRSDQVRLNVLEMIRRACIYRASYLVEAALRYRSPAVREAAATTLAFLADELLRTAPVPVGETDLAQLSPQEVRERMADLESHAEDRRQLVAAIEAAVASYDIHLQPRVVEIATWFLDDMSSAFWTLLTTPGARVSQVAVRLLTPSMSPRMVPFAMAALGFSEFRPHVAKALALGPDPAFVEEWFRQSWRLVQPKVARSMAGLKDLAWASNHGWDLLQLPNQVHRHVARWISSVGLPVSERIDLLREMQQHGDRTLSRSALWALTTIADRRVTEILWAIQDDDEPEVARIARRELARRCPHELPIAELISAKNDWDSLDRTGRPTSPMSFERYWTLYDRMSVEQRTTAAAEVLASTPMFESILARKLASGDPGERVRALRIIADLKLAKSFETTLYQLCHDPTPAVRSAAVAAMGPLETAVSRRLLRGALDDVDTRVQANAVEAIAATGNESMVDDLLSKLSSPDNRVQANAVKALLKLGVREAAETLLRMLRHENRMHRISALWLVERMGLFTLASRVTAMAGEDPDPLVRRRASVLTQELPATAGARTVESATRDKREVTV